MKKILRIGIAGLGTVGGGVLELLQCNKEIIESRCNATISVTAVSARNKNKAQKLLIDGIAWEQDALALAARNDVDVVIELIGGSEGIAKSLVETALKNGKHVITANKALIAHHGVALAALAEQHQVQLSLEPAVGGGIPILHAMRTGLGANRIARVAGILNGTCNYILTMMQREGRGFDEVLADAQKAGYAEADPSFDVDGIDAAHKLAILASLAYGAHVAFDKIHIEGIRAITAEDILYAAELGYRIRLLGIATQSEAGISQRLHPCLVPMDSPLGLTEGVFNAVQVEGDAVGRVLFQGRGAGAGPTASAVISDVIAIARGERYPVFTLPSTQMKTASIVPMHEHECGYYIRLEVADEPGVLADVTRIFAEEKISVQSIIQHEHNTALPAQIVITTHQTREAAMQRALSQIDALPRVVKPPMMLRMETV